MEATGAKSHRGNNNEIAISKAKQKALAMLSFRAYFKAGLLCELKKEYGESVSSKVLSRLEELGIVNDLELSKRYATELAEKKGFSNSKIKSELIKKGVSEDLVISCMSEFADRDSTKEITNILESKFAAFRKDKKVLGRALNFVSRRGYTWEEIQDATDAISEDF
ncbi:MAG: RecX family transcriptional regulator [Oscillospiraceae bacterium]|jgi:regulatory protein|nr:RecX family transcriptional regulator [Oscillospiraceae bacterium]